MTAAYDGLQVVGMDLHRRRSVLVRMSANGRKLDRGTSVRPGIDRYRWPIYAHGLRGGADSPKLLHALPPAAGHGLTRSVFVEPTLFGNANSLAPHHVRMISNLTPELEPPYGIEP
jgi:hypothetical protein